MKIDNKKYEVINYKKTDINEDITILLNNELEENTRKELIKDIIKQLEELKEEIKTLL